VGSVRDHDHDPWEGRLAELCDRIRVAATDAMSAALADGALSAVDRPVGEGAGDVTYGLDVPTEQVLTAWLEECARAGPLSLLTEDAGWRHRGPAPLGGESVALDGFDHGGPRILVDPVDGTRNLMADLRSAWTVIALCPPGAAQPRLSDVTVGVLAELPTSRASSWRRLAARRGAGARLEHRSATDGALLEECDLACDTDDRPDHGYFPFFCFSHAMRPLVASLAAAFFERVADAEGADVRHCYDDQYISNGGQLALLVLGTYRIIADLRGALLSRVPAECTSSRPYDCAGAILIAREAGCAVVGADGGELDFDLDTTTPVSFVGFANDATRARLQPHLSAAWVELHATDP
jgi:fructose-1,6-bisphosphatase/inositol monophosphatase family enzyme